MGTRVDRLKEDILSAIFKCLDRQGLYDLDYRAKRRTLARSARVCKAFHRPAVCVLWRRLEDLIPLFKVLPSFVKVESDGRGGEVYVSDFQHVPFTYDRR